MTFPVDLSRRTWRKSSHSSASGNECVEVAGLPGAVAVRDSKDPAGPKIVFDSDEWRAFAWKVRSGELDR